ncbi:MAG: hypothetical protein ACRCU6_05995 [Fusobacteriaceae bacterium]
MAISILTGSIEESILQFMQNHCIIYFKSDSTLSAEKCKITLTNTTQTEEVVIYPSPSGEFRYDFKDIVLGMNSPKIKKYADDLGNYGNPSLVRTIDWDRLLENMTITLEVSFSNSTTLDTLVLNFKFLNAVSQIRQKSSRELSYIIPKNSKGLILSPVLSNPTPVFSRVKYWEGLPFDITVLNPLPGNQITLKNEKNSNLLNFPTLNPGRVSRLMLSDGTHTDFGTLIGINRNEIPIGIYSSVSGSTTISDLVGKISVEKEELKCLKGYYIKWVNSLGGFSYWYFEIGSEESSIKSLGILENDFYNIFESLSVSENIGSNVDNLIDVYETFNENYIHLLQDLIMSPKIYLFDGKKDVMQSQYDWIEIRLKSGSIPTKELRSKDVRVKLSLELPGSYTRKI